MTINIQAKGTTSFSPTSSADRKRKFSAARYFDIILIDIARVTIYFDRYIQNFGQNLSYTEKNLQLCLIMGVYIFNQMVFRIDILRQKGDLQQTADWNTSVTIIVLCERDLSTLLAQFCCLYSIMVQQEGEYLCTLFLVTTHLNKRSMLYVIVQGT